MLIPVILIIFLIKIQSKLLQQNQKGLYSQCEIFIFIQTCVNIFTSFSKVRQSHLPPNRHQQPVPSHPGREDLLCLLNARGLPAPPAHTPCLLGLSQEASDMGSLPYILSSTAKAGGPSMDQNVLWDQICSSTFR